MPLGVQLHIAWFNFSPSQHYLRQWFLINLARGITNVPTTIIIEAQDILKLFNVI